MRSSTLYARRQFAVLGLRVWGQTLVVYIEGFINCPSAPPMCDVAAGVVVSQ